MNSTLSTKDLNIVINGQILQSGLNLKFATGSITAVLGPNGAGKTSLLRTLSGALPASTGSVLINCENIAALSPQQRAKKIAVVPQASPPPTAMLVSDYLALAQLPWNGQLAQSTLTDAMQMTDVEQFTNKACDHLSGGEWRRVQLARAIAQNTDILILDEPFSALDIKHRQQLSQAVGRLAAAGRCIVLSIHDPQLARNLADQSLLISPNQMTITGPSEQILSNENIQLYFQLNGNDHYL